MKKVYNLAIIGFGGMAINHYKELSKNTVPVKIAGVYDIDVSRMADAREKGLNTYSSLDEALTDNNVDMVLVATYNTNHAEISEKALLAGKHVLCEKPVTTASVDLERLIEISKQCHKVFCVDQNRRFNKDYILVKRTIDSGIIGKPYVIESRVEGSRGVPEGWRCLKEYGGGMMLDWGVHLIDQIMLYVKEKVKTVYCKMYSVHYPEVDDNFHLTITFESGLTAHIEVSTNNFIKHPRWYILGEDGTLQIDDWDCVGRVVKPICDDNTWDVEIAPDKAGPSKTMSKRNENTIETIPLSAPTDVIDSLTPVYQQFIKAIEGEELYIKPEECLRVLKVMEAAFESAEKNIAINTDI